jgi:hypothetical protein
MRERPEDSETFIRFIQAARDDPEFGGLLRGAGRLPAQQRNILLEQMAAKMAANRERKDLIEVVHWLREEAVFKSVLRLLETPGP